MKIRRTRNKHPALKWRYTTRDGRTGYAPTRRVAVARCLFFFQEHPKQ